MHRTSPHLLRPATPEDQARVYEIYEQLFRSDIERIWGWDEDWQRENFAVEWSSAETRIVELGGEIAGYLQRVFKEDHDYLLSLALIPAAQGRGIGTALLQSLQRDAATRDLPLRLSVFRTEERRLHFHQGLGFRVTAEEEAFWCLEWLPGEILGGPENRG